jgi:hypothetical protein
VTGKLNVSIATGQLTKKERVAIKKLRGWDLRTLTHRATRKKITVKEMKDLMKHDGLGCGVRENGKPLRRVGLVARLRREWASIEQEDRSSSNTPITSRRKRMQLTAATAILGRRLTRGCDTSDPRSRDEYPFRAAGSAIALRSTESMDGPARSSASSLRHQPRQGYVTPRMFQLPPNPHFSIKRHSPSATRRWVFIKHIQVSIVHTHYDESNSQHMCDFSFQNQMHINVTAALSSRVQGGGCEQKSDDHCYGAHTQIT